MKIGRNDPCPCGSGKKYKKCCYLKNNLATEDDLQEQNIGDIKENINNMLENINEEEFLLKAFTNLRRFSLDEKPHIKAYYKIRKMHSEIVNSMIAYHQAGKFELKMDNSDFDEHLTNNNETIRYIETKFDFETREGRQAHYDMMIYKATSNMNCITEAFINSHRYRKPEKIEFLQSMLNSYIGLFEIVKTDIKEGYVYVKDVFTGVEYKIVDVALSGSRIYDNIYIYTRLINYNDIMFSTGLNLIFNKEDSYIKNFIESRKNTYKSEAEFYRFTQLYNYYSMNPDKMALVTNSIG